MHLVPHWTPSPLQGQPRFDPLVLFLLSSYMSMKFYFPINWRCRWFQYMHSNENIFLSFNLWNFAKKLTAISIAESLLTSASITRNVTQTKRFMLRNKQNQLQKSKIGITSTCIIRNTDQQRIYEPNSRWQTNENSGTKSRASLRMLGCDIVPLTSILTEWRQLSV